MLVSTYRNSSSSSSSSNSGIRPNYSNGLNQTNFLEESEEWFYQFWERYLRKAWHYIVAPPLIVAAKRLQYEETLKEQRKKNSGRNDPNEDEEEFRIDYKIATKEFFHRQFSEFIGTMILTTLLGANLLEARLGLIRGEAAALTNGLVILFLIYALGVVSGAHLNPVVTLGFTLRRVFPLAWLPFYILSQFVGSIAAGLLIRGLFSGQFASLATNSVDRSLSTVANGFKWEIFLTFCLVFVVLLTATKSAILGSQAAIAVGSVLAVDSVIGGSQSTASMNPWRTLGPSIINNSPDDRSSLWVFIAGPVLGSVIAYVIVSFVQGFKKKPNETTAASGKALYDEPDDADRDVSYGFHFRK